jgi:hypothetical protein
MTIQEMLDQLAEMQSKLDVLNLQEQEQRAAIIPEEVKRQLDDLKLEFDGKRSACDENIAELRELITLAVKAGGATVKGTRLSAVFVKGRVTWDTKGVDGFALAYPALLAYRKEGEPTVQFRSV